MDPDQDRLRESIQAPADEVEAPADRLARLRAAVMRISDALLAQIDHDGVRTGRAKRLRADGTPSGLRVSSVTRD